MIFWLTIITYALPLIFIIILGRRFNKKKIHGNAIKRSFPNFDIKDLTVIVPFRNEEGNLKNFIKSILDSNVLPKAFIFVDDHSEDDSIGSLNGLIQDRVSIQIIQLEEKYKGKKHAIRKGIHYADTPYILLMDADVIFDAYFFKSLCNIKIQDLTILPVIMYPIKWYHHFFILDVNIANAVNEGMTGWKRPVIASGANLLIKKDSFLKWDTQTDFDYHGGDDLHILKDFIDNNADIGFEIDKRYSVKTSAPKNLSAYFSQRLRWIRNSRKVKDEWNTFLMFLQVVLTVLFFSVFTYYLINSFLLKALLLLCLKVIIDLFVFFNFFNQRKQMKSWLLIPIYELLFPIVLIFLTLGSLFVKNNWKGRILN